MDEQTILLVSVLLLDVAFEANLTSKAFNVRSKDLVRSTVSVYSRLVSATSL